MVIITTMTMTATNDLVFLGNNQPWLDAFLAEGWWVISTMMTADGDEDDKDSNNNEDVFNKDV